MRIRRLFWRLSLSHLLVATLALGGTLFLTSLSLRGFHHDQVEAALQVRARLLLDPVRARFLEGADDLDPLCERLGRASGTRITVIRPSGRVVGDSEYDPARMDNHADRPEIRSALAGTVGASVRYSHTLHQHMVYVAVPIHTNGEVTGVVRTSMPMTSVGRMLQRVQGRILAGGVLIALLALLVSLFVSRRITIPVEEMTHGAQRFAEGELDSRLLVPDSLELGGLARAMNEMAAQLEERIRTLTKQQNEQEAILASMVEGVIAVNIQEQVIIMNKAACRMTGVSESDVRGRSIQESIRNRALHDLVARTLHEQTETEGEIVLDTAQPRYLQAHGAVLRDANRESIGAVLVLNDVTRLRQLEDVRRDFVANVSHELRTPLTSIRGFVETLQDGAIESPVDAERFLGIISRQVDQLGRIIEDLLLLSRVEQEDEKHSIRLEPGSIRAVIETAIEVTSVKADRKDISIGLACDESLRANVDAALLGQAVVNLIDNAVNYSDPGSPVHVEAFAEGAEVVIRVRDHGPGIEPDHQARLFERFYRVDKARSRKLGGTGLGLAIVKHITHVHGGTVTVESEVGEGSAFSIRLPPAGL